MSLCENIELRCNKLINGIILYKIIFNLFPYYNLMYKAIIVFHNVSHNPPTPSPIISLHPVQPKADTNSPHRSQIMSKMKHFPYTRLMDDPSHMEVFWPTKNRQNNIKPKFEYKYLAVSYLHFMLDMPQSTFKIC